MRLPLCNLTGGALALDVENLDDDCPVPNFHKCEICLLSFPKESQFQRHMRDHELNDKVCFSRRTAGNAALKLEVL
jgi:uncharacterized Zn-finger protein